MTDKRRLHDWREWAGALLPLLVTAPLGLLIWYFGDH